MEIIISDLEKTFDEMMENRINKVGYILLPEINGFRGFSFDSKELYNMVHIAYKSGKLTQPKTTSEIKTKQWCLLNE